MHQIISENWQQQVAEVDAHNPPGFSTQIFMCMYMYIFQKNK
jgi:hypothetical protein